MIYRLLKIIFKQIKIREQAENPKKSRKKQTSDMKALKIINNGAGLNCITFDDPLIDNEGLALFCSNGVYEILFGKKKKNAEQDRQRLSVVKIKKGNRCIYRKFAARPIVGLDSKSVGLSPNSWQQLQLNNDNIVEVTPSCSFPFFWYHPNSATRVSFRMGILSISLAIIGIVLSIVLKYQ